jgi:hypothetical protein
VAVNLESHPFVRLSQPSAATKPMLGIGNPLLDGNRAERPWEAK